MSLLDGPGDLARTPLAAVLLEALNLRASGVLEVAHGGGTSRLWFRDGRPVGAQVFAGFRPLGLMLLQAGRIDVDTLSKSLVRMAESGRPQGEILLEMRAVSAEDVARALAEQQAGYIGLLAALDAGAFAFDGVAAVPEWTRGSRLSPLRTIVDALARPQAGALVAAALEPAALAGVRLSRGRARPRRPSTGRRRSGPSSSASRRPPRWRPPSRCRGSRPGGPARSSRRSSFSGWRCRPRPAGRAASRSRSSPRPVARGRGARPRPPRRARGAPRPRRAAAIPPRRAPGGSASSSRRSATWEWAPSPVATGSATPPRRPPRRERRLHRHPRQGRRPAARRTSRRFARRSSRPSPGSASATSSSGSACPRRPGARR